MTYISPVSPWVKLTNRGLNFTICSNFKTNKSTRNWSKSNGCLSKDNFESLQSGITQIHSSNICIVSTQNCVWYEFLTTYQGVHITYFTFLKIVATCHPSGIQWKKANHSTQAIKYHYSLQSVPCDSYSRTKKSGLRVVQMLKQPGLFSSGLHLLVI